MSSLQDASLEFGLESVYGTLASYNRLPPVLSSTLDAMPNWQNSAAFVPGVHGMPISAMRSKQNFDGSGDVVAQIGNSGFGLFENAALGAFTNTVVSGGLRQFVFSMADDLPSYSIKKTVGALDASGAITLNSYDILGAMVDSWELDQQQNQTPTFKTSWNFRDVLLGAAAPSVPAVTPALTHFAEFSLYMGAPGTTTPAAAAALVDVSGLTCAGVRAINVQGKNNLMVDRWNSCGLGKKDKPILGDRAVTGTITIENKPILGNDPLSMLLNGTLSQLVGQWSIGGAVAQQLFLNEISLDSKAFADVDKTLPILQIPFTAYAIPGTQSVQLIGRTNDTAL